MIFCVISRVLFRPGCILPQYPQNGHWITYDIGPDLVPGGRVPPGTSFQIYCDHRYQLDDERFGEIFCRRNGTWSRRPGRCSGEKYDTDQKPQTSLSRFKGDNFTTLGTKQLKCYLFCFQLHVNRFTPA